MKKKYMAELFNVDIEVINQYEEMISSYTNNKFFINSLSHLKSKNKNGTMPPQFYSYYPLLFLSEGQREKINDNSIIFLISHFISYEMFILDDLLDSIIVDDKYKIILAHCIQEEVTLLLKDFNQNIRNYYYTLLREYFESMISEKYYYGYNKKYSMHEIEQYCINKIAIAKIVPYIAYENKINCKYDIQAMLSSHDFFAIGRQFLDDLVDMDQDIENKEFNIYNYMYCDKLNRIYNETVNIEQDQCLIRQMIIMSNKFFNKAYYLIKESNCKWKNYVYSYIQKTDNLLNNKKEDINEENHNIEKRL